MQIEIYKGDITLLEVDAIVNAANQSLLGGGGVDGAIHRAAGPDLLKECRELNGCKTGHSKKTLAYNLKAKYVIHTVGPVWSGGNRNEDQLLFDCYTSSMQLAVDLKLKSIAFPNISTGVYSFPKERAAKIAFRSINNFKSLNHTIERVIFAIFDDENYGIYNNLTY